MNNRIQITKNNEGYQIRYFYWDQDDQDYVFYYFETHQDLAKIIKNIENYDWRN